MQSSGKKRFVGAIMLIASIVLGAFAGFAQQQEGAKQKDGHRMERRGLRGGKHGHRFGGRFFESLNLSEAQKAQIQQIATRFRDESRARRQQNQGERHTGGNLFEGGTFNEAAVRAAAQARANAQVEMEVQRARMMFEMYNVLTPEQKAQLATERQQREQKRQEWRGKRKAAAGQNQ